MHKGIIILVKAENREDAKCKVDEFMESYGNGDVWDWYTVGGRWNGNLAPKEKLEKFTEKVNKILVKSEEGWLFQSEVDKKQEDLQKAWEECGLEGLNSYCNHYKLDDDGNVYDIVPLESCLSTVQEWMRDLTKEKEELWDKMIKAKEEEEEGKYSMVGYYAGQYKDAEYRSFCFESNVYNATTGEAEKIPEDMTGYWAVMIDMHN